MPSPSAAPSRRPLPSLLTLTDAAASRLAALREQGDGKTLRVSVRAKGCAGRAYDMSWVDGAGPGDDLVTGKGASLLVDGAAALFLAGSVMDWKEGTLSAGFVFENPNEKGRCGCGESFTA